MQVNPEDSPPKIYVTWSDPRMTDFENVSKVYYIHFLIIRWESGMEQRFLYKSYFVFLYSDATCNKFFEILKFSTFCAEKNQLIIPQSGYCTPFGVYTPIGTFLQPD